nr:MAG TPA: hypothetical protein [Caudoviricetes sp.]
MIVELSLFMMNILYTFIHFLYTYRANTPCHSVPHRL